MDFICCVILRKTFLIPRLYFKKFSEISSGMAMASFFLKKIFHFLILQEFIWYDVGDKDPTLFIF